MNILPYVAAYFAISLPLCLLVVFLGYRAKTPAKPADPVVDALKAERAKPLRHRRTYRAIDRDLQAIINARLAGGR